MKAHAELIHAWADGADVECYDPFDDAWYIDTSPSWNPLTQYRIKPKDVVKYMGFDVENEGHASVFISDTYYVVDHWSNQLKLTFDGKTKALKSAEVLK